MGTNHSGLLCAILLALVAADCGLSFAQTKDRDGQTQAGERTIDQQLLEGLNVPPKSTIPPSPSPPGNPSTPVELLGQVMEQMRAAERRLANRDTSATTQATQRQIVEGIERLLDQGRESAAGTPSARSSTAERNAPGQAGEGDPEPGNANSGPALARRGPGEGAPARPGINHWLDQMWGHLPERVRNQMQAPRSEHFLPKYERTIEEYYLRLAEEQETAP
jgi:hypothetical protein